MAMVVVPSIPSHDHHNYGHGHGHPMTHDPWLVARPRAQWARICGPALPMDGSKVLRKSLGYVRKAQGRGRSIAKW